ncbi:Toxoplasma gondii family E protein, partial [Toxoplasma gondii VAND]
MDEPVQSPSVRKRQAHDEFQISISEAQKHQLPREKRPVITQISEETGIPSDISMIRQYSTNSHRLSDLNATNQDSSTSGVSRRRRRRLENSTLSGRDHTPRRTRAKRRLLSVILTVTLGVYLSKYLSRCVLTPRHAGLSSDTSPLGVQQGKSPPLSSGSRSAVTEKGRRLAAAEWGGGSDESPNTGSQSESKEPICEYPAASGVANASSVLRSQGTGHAVVGPLTGASSSSRGPAASGWELEAFRGQTAGVTHSGHTEAAPLNVSEFLETNFEPGSPSSEAALLREIASVVMSAAAAASEALGRVRLSSSGLRLALQHLGEGYGCLMEEAKSVEAGKKRESNDEGTAGLERPSHSRIGVADTDSPTAEPMPSSQTTAINRTQTSEALGNGPRPLSTRISFVSQVNSRYGRGSSLATIHESAPSEQADAGDEFDPWRHNGGSMFTDVVWDAKDDGTQPSSLEEAMSIVGMDEGMVGGWNPFSSTTSTSDAWGKFVTDQSDARETAGDDANDVTGSPPRRPSYSEVVKHASRSLSAPPRSTAANGQGMAKRVAGLGQRLTSSGHRQSATSRDVSGGRRHYPSGPRVPGRRPTNRFESID